MDASSTAQMSNSEFQRCNTCRQMKPISESHFKARADGALFKTCRECLEKKKKAHLNKLRRNANKENLTQAPDGGFDDQLLPPVEHEDSAVFKGMETVRLDAFVRTLSETGGKIETITAKVDVSGMEASGLRDIADKVAKAIWECSGYRFTYHSVYTHKLELSSNFRYSCAQMHSRRRSNKGGCDDGKERRKRSMQTFECHGWLHITVYEGSLVIEISIQHKEEHLPYRCIDVSPAIQEFIKANPGMSTVQIWKKILKIDPAPAYTRKAMHNYRVAMGRRSDEEMEKKR